MERDIQLSLNTRSAALLHASAEVNYAGMLGMADRFAMMARLADFEVPGSNVDPRVVRENIAESFRDEAEVWRHIGQQIELLLPDLEPGDWTWPRRG